MGTISAKNTIVYDKKTGKSIVVPVAEAGAYTTPTWGGTVSISKPYKSGEKPREVIEEAKKENIKIELPTATERGRLSGQETLSAEHIRQREIQDKALKDSMYTASKWWSENVATPIAKSTPFGIYENTTPVSGGLSQARAGAFTYGVIEGIVMIPAVLADTPSFIIEIAGDPIGTAKGMAKHGLTPRGAGQFAGMTIAGRGIDITGRITGKAMKKLTEADTKLLANTPKEAKPVQEYLIALKERMKQGGAPKEKIKQVEKEQKAWASPEQQTTVAQVEMITPNKAKMKTLTMDKKGEVYGEGEHIFTVPKRGETSKAVSLQTTWKRGVPEKRLPTEKTIEMGLVAKREGERVPISPLTRRRIIQEIAEENFRTLPEAEKVAMIEEALKREPKQMEPRTFEKEMKQEMGVSLAKAIKSEKKQGIYRKGETIPERDTIVSTARVVNTKGEVAKARTFSVADKYKDITKGKELTEVRNHKGELRAIISDSKAIIKRKSETGRLVRKGRKLERERNMLDTHDSQTEMLAEYEKARDAREWSKIRMMSEYERQFENYVLELAKKHATNIGMRREPAFYSRIAREAGMRNRFMPAWNMLSYEKKMKIINKEKQKIANRYKESQYPMSDFEIAYKEAQKETQKQIYEQMRKQMQKQKQGQKIEEVTEQQKTTASIRYYPTPRGKGRTPPLRIPSEIKREGKKKKGEKGEQTRITSIDDPLYRLSGKSKYSDIMNMIKKQRHGNVYI